MVAIVELMTAQCSCLWIPTAYNFIFISVANYLHDELFLKPIQILKSNSLIRCHKNILAGLMIAGYLLLATPVGKSQPIFPQHFSTTKTINEVPSHGTFQQCRQSSVEFLTHSEGGLKQSLLACVPECERNIIVSKSLLTKSRHILNSGQSRSLPQRFKKDLRI